MTKEIETIKKLSALLQQALELLAESAKQNKEAIGVNIIFQKMIDSLQQTPQPIKKIPKLTTEPKIKFKFVPELNYIG